MHLFEAVGWVITPEQRAGMATGRWRENGTSYDFGDYALCMAKLPIGCLYLTIDRRLS